VTSSTATAHEEPLQSDISPVSTTTSRTPVQLFSDEMSASATTSSNQPFFLQHNDLPLNTAQASDILTNNDDISHAENSQPDFLDSSEFNGKINTRNLLFNCSLIDPMQIERQYKSREPQEVI
jgi:hypothetical protein